MIDQFVASGLFLLRRPLSAAGQPNGALSVDGRGRSEDAIDAGLGLLGSLSEYTAAGSSMLEPNMLKPRRLLAAFRAGAGAFPSDPPRLRNGNPLQPVEKLVRRLRTANGSMSCSCLGNDWLCPAFKVPRAGPSSCIVFPRCLGKVKMSPNRLAGAGCTLAPLGDPMTPKSATGECSEWRSVSTS